MQVDLGLSAYKRRAAWNPQVRVVNLLAEESPTNRFNGIDHIQRPGLVQLASLGSTVVRGVFRQAGTFGGDILATMGTQMFRVTSAGVVTVLGTITGSNRTVTAATATRAITVAGTTAYSTDGVSVTPVVMPDARPVSSVAQLNGYFLLADATPGSARVYYIEPGNTDPGGLDFFSTESVPGTNVGLKRVGDEIWIAKEEGMEVHVTTGDADLPFQRVPGRNYEKGCRNRDTLVNADNSLTWVTSDGLVCQGAGTPVRISNHTVEEDIRKTSLGGLRAWGFSIDGHALYCLSTPQATHVYDFSNQQWTNFKSYGENVWRAHVGDAADTFTVAGDYRTGILYKLDATVSTDNGDPMERIITGGVALLQPTRCDSFSLYMATGTASDPNLYPKARVRWSDDLETFGDFVDVSIGRQGRYGEPVVIRRLGRMREPGRIFEVTVTDDVVVRFSAAAVNEAGR